MMRTTLAGLLLLSGLVWADQTQFDFANGLFQRGFYQEAADEYKAYIEQNPQGEHVAVALYRLGESAYAAHDYAAALEAFDQATKRGLDPDTRQRASLSRAEVLYFLKRPADAALALEPLTAKSVKPDLRGRALYYLGKVNADSKNTDAAVQAFKTLVDSIPDSAFVPYAHLQLASVWLDAGQFENAATELAAVANSPSADATLRAEARFRAAEAYDKIGWYAQAVEAYEKLKKDFPESKYVQRAEYGYAWALFRAGKYDEAHAASQALLKGHPETPHAAAILFLQGNCLQQLKKYDEALALYAKVRSDYAKSDFAPRAQYKAAWCLYLSGKIEEAKKEASTFLQGAPDSALTGDGAFLLGTIMVSQGDYEGAYEEFRLVADKYPKSEFGAEALYKAGECLAQLGRTNEAADIFETFAKQYPDNILAEQAILRAGDAELLSSSFEAAVAKYKQILDKQVTPEVEVDTLYRLAITYHNLKDYEASAKTFKTLLSKYPKCPHVAEAHLRIGDYYLRDNKDVVAAIEAYRAALNADATGTFAGRAIKGLALARYAAKDYDAAAAQFLKLMTEYPDVELNPDSYTWVAQRFFDQKKWDEAATACAALLKAVPSYANPERVRFKIAECSDAAGKTDEAIALYKAVVEAAPQSAVASDAKFRMAELFESNKKTDDAFALYEEVANSNTGEKAARARLRLGELYEAKGDFDAAAKSYMRVAILFLHEELSPEALWRAGQCFEKAGSPEQAHKNYEELLRDYPKSPYAAKAQGALDKTAPPRAQE